MKNFMKDFYKTEKKVKKLKLKKKKEEEMKKSNFDFRTTCIPILFLILVIKKILNIEKMLRPYFLWILPLIA
jgi:hypothetical protein